MSFSLICSLHLRLYYYGWIVQHEPSQHSCQAQGPQTRAETQLLEDNPSGRRSNPCHLQAALSPPPSPVQTLSPPAHPGGGWGCDSDQGPLVSSALNSRGEGRPVQDPRAFPRRLSRPGLCPGFLRKRGRAPLRPVRGCGPPRVERTWTVPAGSRPAPPQCPDAPGWGALRLTRDPGALLLSLCSRAPLPPAAQSLALLPNYPH